MSFLKKKRKSNFLWRINAALKTPFRTLLNTMSGRKVATSFIKKTSKGAKRTSQREFYQNSDYKSVQLGIS
jgi:hypothetical protein